MRIGDPVNEDFLEKLFRKGGRIVLPIQDTNLGLQAQVAMIFHIVILRPIEVEP